MRKRFLSLLLALCLTAVLLPAGTAAETSYGDWSDWGDSPVSPSDTVDVETRRVVDVEGHTEYRYGRWLGKTVNWCKEYGESLHGGTYSVQETPWTTVRATDTGTNWTCGKTNSQHSSHIHTNGTNSKGYPTWRKYEVSGYSNPDFFWEETRWVDTTYKTQYRWREIRVTPDSFTVTFDPNGGTVETGEKTVTNGEAYGSLPEPLRQGYRFEGWYTDPAEGQPVDSWTTVSLSADQTLYAHWSQGGEAFTVTLGANGGVVEPERITVYNGLPYGALPVPDREAYNFAGWYTEADGGTEITSETVVDLDGDQTLYAHWTEAPRKNLPPTVTTNRAADITKYSAIFSGTVENDGGESIVTRQIVYWDKYDSSSRYTVNADASFRATVKNLSPGSTYYYYAKAANASGEGVGSVLSLTTETEDVPRSVEVSPAFLSLKTGDSYQLLANVLPASASNRNVIWSSSNPGVARVDSAGRVTVRKNGSAVISAVTEEGRLSASCTVSVTESAVEGRFDFSEWNMASNTASYAEDGFDWDTATLGGNYMQATAYLARWDGAVLETGDAYPRYDGSARSHYQEAAADYHVQEVLWLPLRAEGKPLDNEELKTALMHYGAVSVSFAVNWDCFDPSGKTYYLPEGEDFRSGHAVTLVGWDDRYPASAFVRTPPGDGAFICKNSWGTGSGEDGYFYISYYDAQFARRNMSAVVPSIQRNTNYNTIYQYDPLGPCAFLRCAYAANVFPQAGAALETDETLRAVSFYTHDKNTSYEVYVVRDYQGGRSLARMGVPVASGVIREMGYHTVALAEELTLKAGSRFAVIVKFSVEDETAAVYLEYPQAEYSGKARANADESYYSENGTDWLDLTGRVENGNFCIKAFTDNGAVLSSASLFRAIDNESRSYASDRVYTPEEALAAGLPVSDSYLAWRRENASETASLQEEDAAFALGEVPAVVDGGGNTVSFVDGAILPSAYDLRREGCVTEVRDQGDWGTCWAHAMCASLESCLMKRAKTVSAAVGNTAGEADALALDGQFGVAASGLSLSREAVVMAENATCRLYARLEPANTTETAVRWSSDDESVVTVDTNGLLTAVQPGSTVVRASAAGGALTAACNVMVGAGEAVRNVTLAQDSLTKALGEVFLADYTVNPSEALNQAVTWSSSDPSVVSVNENGRMEARSVGTAEVTVRTVEGGFSDSLSVTVTDGQDYALRNLSSHLTAYDANLFGSVDVALENRAENNETLLLYLAVYSEKGQLLACCLETAAVQPGTDTLTLNNLVFEGVGGDGALLRCYALRAGALIPAAAGAETPLA